MKARSSLRAPFVVTLAAAAMGCGASVTVDARDASAPTDGQAHDDRATPTDQAVVRRGCPPSLPANGAPCTPGVDPDSCFDASIISPSCSSSPGLTAVCNASTRAWQRYVSTCNPPAPVRCPADLPARGGPCPQGYYPASVLHCEYTPCGDYNIFQANCAGPTSQWEVIETSCNPPAVMCPPEAPAPGDPCALPPSFSCAWNYCRGEATTRGACVDNRWSIVSHDCLVDAGAGPDV